MKLWLAALIGIATLPAPACAEPNPLETGGGYLARCADQRDGTWVNACTGYVAGLHDAVATMRALAILPACPAHTQILYGEVKARLLDYLRTHPEAATDDTLFSMVNALEIARPCGNPSGFARPASRF